MSEASNVILSTLSGLVNLYKMFGSDAILVMPNVGDFTAKGYITWENGGVYLDSLFQKSFKNAISICKAQGEWKENNQPFYADRLSSFVAPIVKTLAKIEPERKEEIKKQLERLVGEI